MKNRSPHRPSTRMDPTSKRMRNTRSSSTNNRVTGSTSLPHLSRSSSSIGTKAKPRRPLSALLHLFGSLLGIIQLFRLYKLLGNNDTSVTSLSPISGKSSSRSSTEVVSGDKDISPEGSTRPISNEQTTLFPPYMFYTAANITKAEIESKEFRSHCQQLNPSYEIITYDDDMSRRFVMNNYPEWLPLYDSLPPNVPVLRADMWRYLILHRYGGVYLDGDVDCKKPIDQWGNVFGIQAVDSGKSSNTQIGAMVGIEYRRPLRGYEAQFDKLQFTQWTMAGQPGHYIYYRTIELINETMTHIRSGGEPPGDAVYLTGPVVFSRAVVDFMLKRGRLNAEQIMENPPGNHDILVNDPTLTFDGDLMVDDLAILHEDAFAYRGRNKGEATNEDHPTVYARHWYSGSWKPKQWKTMTEKQVHEASRTKVLGKNIQHVLHMNVNNQ